jgi:hypothetical protein
MKQYRCEGCNALLLGEDSDDPYSLCCCRCTEQFGVSSGEPFSEADWLACTDMWGLLLFACRTLSARKRLLLTCACLRRRKLIKFKRYLRAVEVGERFADGLVARAAVDEEVKRLRSLWHEHVKRHGTRSWVRQPSGVHFVHTVVEGLEHDLVMFRMRSEHGDHVVLHDLYGNPFRPATKPPAGLDGNDSTVRRVAQTIYDERRFDEMPVLADSLEDAGCTDEQLLSHCRQRRHGHWAGCWALDLLLDLR